MRKRIEEDRIYSTALASFSKYGYKKTTLEDIGQALGISNTSLYSYAKSKRDLYNGCISYYINDWQESVRQAVKEIEDPVEKLMVSFKAAVGYINNNKELQALLKNDPSIFPMFPTIDPIEEYNDWSVSFITEIVKDGVEKGIFKEVAIDQAGLILFNFYKYLIISLYEYEGLDRENLEGQMDAIADILLHGFLKE